MLVVAREKLHWQRERERERRRKKIFLLLFVSCTLKEREMKRYKRLKGEMKKLFK